MYNSHVHIPSEEVLSVVTAVMTKALAVDCELSASTDDTGTFTTDCETEVVVHEEVIVVVEAVLLSAPDKEAIEW